jgi:peptidylprolyl isomerase
LNARRLALLTSCSLLLAGSITAKPVTVADLLAGSPAKDWRTPDPDDTVYLQLASGRVVIELSSTVAPQHVANIKTLVKAHYFDGLAIIRVQDNYVVQWDDADHKKPLPPGLKKSQELVAAPAAAERFRALPDADLYASEVGFIDDFPAGRDNKSHTAWLAHCYGMVGVGRDEPAESDGSELYAVIGNSLRQLDRNVTLVGRVLRGVELLSTLPRGSGEMGFYAGAEKPVPILSMRLGSELPAAERTSIEVLRTDSPTFKAVLDQRRNRNDSWFKFNPGRIDLCNIPLPTRSVPEAHR